MLGPWLLLAMFHIVCFLKSGAVNQRWLGLWLLDDQEIYVLLNFIRQQQPLAARRLALA